MYFPVPQAVAAGTFPAQWVSMPVTPTQAASYTGETLLVTHIWKDKRVAVRKASTMVCKAKHRKRCEEIREKSDI